jgi:hypothetical protein
VIPEDHRVVPEDRRIIPEDHRIIPEDRRSISEDHQIIPDDDPAIGDADRPYAVGWLRDATGSFSGGLMAMAGLLVLSTVMSWSLKLVVRQE